jgi:hypothetical protein
MPLRIRCFLLALALIASGNALAETVRTETFKPPPAADKGRPTGHLPPLADAPEIITDLSRLPAPVARTRERILAAAKSGDLQQLAALMNETTPVFRSRTTRIRSLFGRRAIPIPMESRCSRS